jgi:acyl CoA:acetate/3-ketoacid CoA transferase alpha subunit
MNANVKAIIIVLFFLGMVLSGFLGFKACQFLDNHGNKSSDHEVDMIIGKKMVDELVFSEVYSKPDFRFSIQDQDEEGRQSFIWFNVVLGDDGLIIKVYRQAGEVLLGCAARRHEGAVIYVNEEVVRKKTFGIKR